MAQPVKRDAATAFDGIPNGTPQQRKRHRKRTEQNAPAVPKVVSSPITAVLNTTEQEPAQSPFTKAPSNKDKVKEISARMSKNHPALEAGKQERKRHRKNQDSRTAVVIKAVSPTVVADPNTAEPEITSIEHLKKRTSAEREKELSERLSEHHAAMEAVKLGRKKVLEAYVPKKSERSQKPKSKKQQSTGRTEPTSTDSPAQKKLLMASKTPSKDVIPERRVVDSSKRLKSREVTLEKKPKTSPSKRAKQLLKQANGEQPATDEQTKQLVSRRPRERKKKSKTAEPVAMKPQKLEGNELGWVANATNGGMFIDQDPLLTKNDEFLILPTHSEVQVYSSKTSLLVRSLRMGSKSNVTSCAFSTVNPNILYVSSSQGSVSIWDWTTATQIAQTALHKGIRQVMPMYSRDDDETLLLLSDGGRGSRNLVVCRVNSSQESFTDMTTILQRFHLSTVRSFAEGSVLVVYAEDKLLVGQSQMTADGQPDLSYTWREVALPGRITSLDASVNSGKSKTARKVPQLDVVVGLGDGIIVYYEDLLFKLIGKEKKNKSTTEDITGRKLHWHRTAVNAVKWSRDRNYIISGGNETVLVIWQLDSNQKQFLPHLSTPILNLAVSSAGSSYALRLADNSVMVLSTADLLPSTNITGLAVGQASHVTSTILFHPHTPHRLLAAIPSDAFHNNSLTSLQIYDIDSSLQLTRQALTRNMITASNVAPTGQPVKEPTVINMDLSHDGKWLATVDEWTPRNQDLEAMYVSSDSKALRGRVTETSLRLWLWNEDANTFEQVTRIDEPHKPGPGSVLGMSFNPAKLELATIGTDAAVQIWSPKSRHRNGMSVRNSANEQLYTWTNTRTIHCDQDASTDEAAPHAALAYAEDGSVIAASWAFPNVNTSAQSSPSPPRFTHLFDPSTGKIVFSQPSLLNAGPAKLLFHTRYLLCLSSSLQIFDTITCQSLTSPITFDPSYVSPQSQAPIFLARNKFDGTFAVGVGKSEWPRISKVAVFSFENESDAGEGGGAEGRVNGAVDVKIVYQGSFTGMLKGMLALTAGPGYFLIDERNQTRVLRRTGAGARVGGLAVTHGSGKPKIETDEVTRSLDGIFGRRSRAGQRALTDGAARAMDSAPAVRGLLTSSAEDAGHGADAGGLESVLRFTTSAMAPSPAELFTRVVGVLGRAVEAK